MSEYFLLDEHDGAEKKIFKQENVVQMVSGLNDNINKIELNFIPDFDSDNRAKLYYCVESEQYDCDVEIWHSTTYNDFYASVEKLKAESSIWKLYARRQKQSPDDCMSIEFENRSRKRMLTICEIEVFGGGIEEYLILRECENLDMLY